MSKSLRLCECGCGEYTKLASKTATKRGWIKGQPLRFINGHNATTRIYEKSEIEKECSYCGNTYFVGKWRKDTAKFCSPSCRTSYLNRTNARGYGELRSENGYLKIKIPEHPYCDKSGYVFLHRYIIEQRLGYPINPKDYDVHHIDEDKTNNNLSNLVAIRRSAHMRLHAIKRKFWEWSPR
jgi:hypothetical protein